MHAGEQLKAALSGKVLLSVRLPSLWDRVVELSFGVRPGDAYTHRLLLEVRTHSTPCDGQCMHSRHFNFHIEAERLCDGCRTGAPGALEG